MPSVLQLPQSFTKGPGATPGAGVSSHRVLNKASWAWRAKDVNGVVDGLYLVDRTAGRNHASFGSSAGAAVLPYAEGLGLRNGGVANNYAYVGDTAVLDITGDITIVAKVAMDDWTPASAPTLVGKWYGTGNQFSYLLGLTTGGNIILYTYDVGPGALSNTSTVATGATDGDTLWIAANLDLNDGGGNRVCQFWTSTDGVTWTQLGATVTTGVVASIQNSTARLTVGANQTGSPMFGNVYRAQVYSGSGFSTAGPSGTLVADFDPDTDATVGATSWTGSADGLTWTVNSSAADSSDPTFLDHTGTDYLFLPGVSGNTASTPYDAAFDLSGNMDLRIFCRMTNVTGLSHGFISKDADWGFWLPNSTDKLRFTIPGMIDIQASVTLASVGVTPEGTDYYFRVTRTAGSPNTYRFYYSTDGSAWTQIGADVTNASAVGTGLATLYVGDCSFSTAEFTGRIYWAEVRDDIDGTVVARFDPADANGNHSSWTGANDGLTWTINRSASGKPAWLVDEPCVLFDGTDDYAVVADGPTELDLGTGPDTICVAFRPVDATPSGYMGLMKKRKTGGDVQGFEMRLDITDGALRTIYDGGTLGDSTDSGTAPFSDLTRGTAISVRDGTYLTAYADGLSVDSGAENSRDVDYAADLQLGYGTGYFRGAIYSAVVFKGVGLTAAQAANLHQELTS